MPVETVTELTKISRKVYVIYTVICSNDRLFHIADDGVEPIEEREATSVFLDMT